MACRRKKDMLFEWFSQLYLSFFFPATFDVDGCTFRLLFIVSPYRWWPHKSGVLYPLHLDGFPRNSPFGKPLSLTKNPRQDPDFSKLEPITVPASMGLGILAPSPYEKITKFFIGRNKPFPSQKGGLSMALFCPHYFLFGSIWFHNCYMFSCTSTLVNGSFIMI